MAMAQTLGLGTLFERRLSLHLRNPRSIVVPLFVPAMFALVIAPALAKSLGSFRPDVDYQTYVAIAAGVLMLPIGGMLHGLQVIIDKRHGITPELLSAPVRRSMIPLGNALAVLVLSILQLVVLVVLATARGAEVHTSVAGVAWFFAAGSLMTLGSYGIAEVLAALIGVEDEYIALTPVVIVPWFLAGSMFPITALPKVLESIALVLPWTHAIALMRYGMMQGSDSGLASIWHLSSGIEMAALSASVLALFAVVMLTAAVKAFERQTVA